MAKMAGLAAEGITNLRDYIQGRMDERDDLLAALEKERKNAEDSKDADRIKLVDDMVNFVTVKQFEATE
jgi:hypothetical protein